MGKVSIIIPVYNVKDYLIQCVETIIKQSYKKYEIILVDDGSTDGSGKICDDYSKRYSFIKVIHKNNEGVSKARNIGIKNAKGEYIIFIDADDYLADDYLENMVKNIEKNNYDVCSCNYFKAFNNITEIKYFKGKEYISKNNFLNYVCDEKKIGGYLWNKIYRSSIIKKYNLEFDEKINIMEDLLFNIELSKHINKCCNIDEPLYYYRQREGSAVYNHKNYNNFYAIRKIIDELDNQKCKYANYFKLRYLFESKKCEILKIKPNLKKSVHINNLKKYAKLRTYTNYGNVILKTKIVILYLFPWIYKINNYKR